MNCQNCGCDLSHKPENKFCSKSCSVSFNNRKRTLSDETKFKIKNSVLEWCGDNNMSLKIHRQCRNCNNVFYSKSSGRKFCSDQCRISYDRRNYTDFMKYRIECKFQFNVFNYPNEFNLSLINKFGLYKAKNRGNNLNGVSRDHMFSILDGFKNNINPKLIAHPANCRLVQQIDNSKKHSKSILTIDELTRRIKTWNKKYGKQD